MGHFKLYRLQRKLIYKKYGLFAFFVLLPYQFRLISVSTLQKNATILKFSHIVYKSLVNFLLSPITWILIIITSISYYLFTKYEYQIYSMLLNINETYLKF
jgi:hypothetical protein